MKQNAPDPTELESLVVQVRYRKGWQFCLDDIERDPADTHGQSAGGLTLVITTLCANSYHAKSCETCLSPVTNYRVNHYFIVPAATYGRQAWLDWLMDCIEQVELHEAREFFILRRTSISTLGESQEIVEHPFAPNHGPGRDPYRRYSYASENDRRTSFRGELK